MANAAPAKHPIGHFVTVGRFTDHAQAENAVAWLRAAGVGAELRDRQTAGLNWFYLPLLGGMRLQVPADQLDSAERLLAEVSPQPLPTDDATYLTLRRRRIRTIALVALLVLAVSWFTPLACVVS